MLAMEVSYALLGLTIWRSHNIDFMRIHTDFFCCQKKQGVYLSTRKNIQGGHTTLSFHRDRLHIFPVTFFLGGLKIFFFLRKAHSLGPLPRHTSDSLCRLQVCDTSLCHWSFTINKQNKLHFKPEVPVIFMFQLFMMKVTYSHTTLFNRESEHYLCISG